MPRANGLPVEEREYYEAKKGFSEARSGDASCDNDGGWNGSKCSSIDLTHFFYKN